MATSSQSDRKRRRGGPPLGLLGLAALVALVGAYLGDCIPGLGAGGSPSAPSSEAVTPPSSTLPADDADPAEAETKAQLSIVVTGERCDAGSGAAPCPEVCAGLDASRAAASTVVIDATAGTHGTVEALRTCLAEAGFTDLRVRSE
ncbi:MAG: hypothetical protein AB1Z98_38835 [Nannocystaceae bacterium]